jgi:signal transduction histidine kinase
MPSGRLKRYLEAPVQFARELRRRKVIKVAAVYAVVGWLVIQIATQTFPVLHLPEWTATLVVVLTLLGFPIALVLAWALEITPAGIRAEHPLPTSPAPAPQSHPARWMTRSPPSSPHSPRPTAASSIPPASDTAPPDPAQAQRAIIAGLRHDLRTPMNAILGYGGVLLMEAEELSIGALVPDIQHVQTEARRFLEQIDRLLPSGPEAAEIDVDTIRGHAHEALLRPAESLVGCCEALVAKADNSERAAADL